MTNVIKAILIAREQFYIDILFKLYPNSTLNLLPQAGSTKGYKHKPIFSLNRTGNLNPMFNKIKSSEFLAMQTQDRKGSNNPQFGIKKSLIIRAKLTNYIYVYNSLDLSLIGIFGTVKCAREFKMGNDTLKKYLKSGYPYKGKIFSYTKLN
jgi:group I intron endonuclease